MSKKYQKNIAIILSLIVIMLPVYSASAFAALDIEARGQDNLKNIIKERDFVTFKAVASISGDAAITPEQVLLGSNLQFDICAADINGFACQLRFPATSDTLFEAKAIPYTITLKDDAGSVVETKSDNFYVDNSAPIIKSFKKETAAEGKVKFSFEVEDKACSASTCAGKCSGISKVELSDVNGNFKETVAINTDSCTATKTFETSESLFAEGAHTIIAKAFDKFNLVSAASSLSFDSDKIAPFIDANTLKIVDELDKDIGFFGANPVAVTVKVDIKDSDLDKENVFADLREIDKNLNVDSLKANCGQTVNEITTCSWQISLNPNNAGAKNIAIEASDSKSNKAKTTLTKNLELDSKGPVVLSIVSSQVIDGQSFAKLQDNVFTATLKEEGAGLKVSDVKLHFNGNIKNADSCVQTLDIWQCVWNDIDFGSAGKASVSIDTDSKDRLGNSAQRAEVQVIVDNIKPRALKITVRGIGGIQGTLGNITKTGDKIQVEAAIEDDNIQKAVADFSKFILNANNVNVDSCVKTAATTFVCSWTSPSIDIDGFVNDFIKLDFTDVSGNVLTVNYPFKVFGVAGEETPDFFTSKAECSPTLLDRETFPLINQRAFCLVTLTPKSLLNTVGTFEDVTPLSFSIGQCQGDNSLVEKVELLNNIPGVRDPVIKISFKKQDARIDELKLNCPIDILSKKGNSIFTSPEKENVDVKFQFYNMPLGEVSSSVKAKIDTAVEDADNILKIATFLKKVGFYAERICQFVNVFQNIIASWQLFTSLIGKAEDAASVNPIAKAALYEARKNACVGTEALHETQTGGGAEGKGFMSTLHKFCKIVNCKQSPGDFGDSKWLGWLGQWQSGGNKMIGAVGGDILKDWTGKTPSDYMNPKDSIVVASLTACIPGIIYGLDKYRQIQCMYADCLQTGVGKQGLPVFACEDQKSYATCKYIVGEVFQVIPYTALFNYYAKKLKDTLSNPFKIIGAGLAYGCSTLCPSPTEGPHTACIAVKIASLLGETLDDVTKVIDEGIFTIRDDFCDRLEESDSKGKTSKGGLFG